MVAWQRTLQKQLLFAGKTLHLGQETSVRVSASGLNKGIVFRIFACDQESQKPKAQDLNRPPESQFDQFDDQTQYDLHWLQRTHATSSTLSSSCASSSTSSLTSLASADATAATTSYCVATVDTPALVEEIPASYTSIDPVPGAFCTRLVGQQGYRVVTVEHLMSALAAFRITNAEVDVFVPREQLVQSQNATELPILDGSSLEFTKALQQSGIADQMAPVPFLRILKPVQVLQKDKAAWLLPHPDHLYNPVVSGPTLSVSIQVNFERQKLGTRQFSCILSHSSANAAYYLREIAPARTFTFEEELDALRANGLAKGGSLGNAVVFGRQTVQPHAHQSEHRKKHQRASHNGHDLEPEEETDPKVVCGGRRVLNPEGLRFFDEWVRHKMLDCIGDLHLSSLPLHGIFMATSPGHALTQALIRKLYSDRSNYQEVFHQNAV